MIATASRGELRHKSFLGGNLCHLLVSLSRNYRQGEQSLTAFSLPFLQTQESNLSAVGHSEIIEYRVPSTVGLPR
jgi:hypothetical protein